VISIQDLLQAAHLIPRFGSSKVDVSWVNGDVLELADDFYYPAPISTVAWVLHARLLRATETPSLFRGDIKEMACKNTAGYFQLGPNSNAIIERLLPDHLYIFPQTFDAQGLPSPVRRKPYQAEPIFVILFETFFKNMKSVGSQFPQRFLDIAKNKARRPEIPISMLAIVCTAIYAALLAKKTKSGDEFKFTGNQFCDNYNYHVSVLERLRETAPNKFHKMMSDIYEEVQCLRLDTSGGYAQDVSLTFLDIDGMDDE
ncbi:hypothetical protein CY34DRAFT_109646, partial [Suillus luteus UH-Slu-Lm8-n1]